MKKKESTCRYYHNADLLSVEIKFSLNYFKLLTKTFI